MSTVERITDSQLQRAGAPPLFTRTYTPEEPARGEVVYLHGYDDHCGRAAAFLEAVAGAGYRVRAFDFRGHGRSGGKRGACGRWEEYLEDLGAILAAEPGGGPVTLVAQSHGCLVALHWVLAHPATVTGLVLCAPYLRLVMPVPRLKLAMAQSLSRLAPGLPLKSEIRTTMLTRDADLRRETEEDRLLSRVATPRWFCTSQEAQRLAFARAPEVRHPALMLHGEADPIADPAAAHELFAALGSPDKRLSTYAGMLHEPLRETGREDVWAEIIAWLHEHSRVPCGRA